MRESSDFWVLSLLGCNSLFRWTVNNPIPSVACVREQQIFYGHCETLLYRGGDGFVITASMFNVILGLSNFKYTVKKICYSKVGCDDNVESFRISNSQHKLCMESSKDILAYHSKYDLPQIFQTKLKLLLLEEPQLTYLISVIDSHL